MPSVKVEELLTILKLVLSSSRLKILQDLKNFLTWLKHWETDPHDFTYMHYDIGKYNVDYRKKLYSYDYRKGKTKSFNFTFAASPSLLQQQCS